MKTTMNRPKVCQILARSSSPPGILKQVLIVATVAAMTVGVQSSAWAAVSCADGVNTLPAGGFQANAAPTVNWTPGVFTGTVGSVFVPDISVDEFNDLSQPLTVRGHNWVMDQGSTLCKETDVGPAGAVSTSWSIPPNNPTDCVVLPIFQGGKVQIGDIPGQSDSITPTCDPSKLSTFTTPNPANTYFNQLGCAISQELYGNDIATGLPFATTPTGAPLPNPANPGTNFNTQPAPSYLFVPGIKSGMFSVQLNNVTNPQPGGEAGKVTGQETFYSAIPLGQKLTSATVSRDGMFAIATSKKQLQTVFACLNPLGDPGDPSGPINFNFANTTGGAVMCMGIGNNGLQVDLTTMFGPDNQPYFGGQRVVNSFNSNGSGSVGLPGGTQPSAWPQCIYQNFGFPGGITPSTLMGRLQAVFTAKSSGHCGNAGPNLGWLGTLAVQPQAMITHGNYMYAAGVGQPVIQMKVTINPFNGQSAYGSPTTYLTGQAITTGLGVSGDQQSLMVFTDPSGLGLAGQEVIWKTPLCEAP